MGFLAGKRALILGIASNRSIAWGIAQAMRREGAELALTYQNDKLKPRIEKMAADLGSSIALPCEVESDADIEAVFESLKQRWDGLDILVHSIAYAPREALEALYALKAKLPKTSDVEKSMNRSDTHVNLAASRALAVPIILTRMVSVGLLMTVSIPAMAAAWTTISAPIMLWQSFS